MLDYFLDPLSRCLDAESTCRVFALGLSASVQRRGDALAEQANEDLLNPRHHRIRNFPGFECSGTEFSDRLRDSLQEALSYTSNRQQPPPRSTATLSGGPSEIPDRTSGTQDHFFVNC